MNEDGKKNGVILCLTKVEDRWSSTYSSLQVCEQDRLQSMLELEMLGRAIASICTVDLTCSCSRCTCAAMQSIVMLRPVADQIQRVGVYAYIPVLSY